MTSKRRKGWRRREATMTWSEANGTCQAEAAASLRPVSACCATAGHSQLDLRHAAKDMRTGEPNGRGSIAAVTNKDCEGHAGHSVWGVAANDRPPARRKTGVAAAVARAGSNQSGAGTQMPAAVAWAAREMAVPCGIQPWRSPPRTPYARVRLRWALPPRPWPHLRRQALRQQPRRRPHRGCLPMRHASVQYRC